jgi:uncharacterized protein YggE
MDTGVSVVGSGQVSAAPDVLRVTFGVEQAAPDVAAAVAHVSELTDAVLAALQGQGLDRSQLGTSSVNVFQEYKEPGATETTYRASHTISVETKDLNGFGALLNAAVDAAGNGLTLHGLSFDIEDKTELLTRARELAFQQARSKAAELAALAGFSLGSVTAIQESQSHSPWREQSATLSKGGAYDSALTLTPGDNTVEVSLQLHFAWA